MTVSAERPVRRTPARGMMLLGSGTITAALVAAALAAQPGSPKAAPSPSLIENEATLAVRQPGPHAGGGDTTAFPFFSSAAEFKTAFRKRVLHAGSAIGYHRQEVDEIYYVLSGTGEYTLNGVTREVGPGTAMLTRPGDSHGLRAKGGDLAIIITYQLSGKPD